MSLDEILRGQEALKKSLDLLHWKIETLAGRLVREVGTEEIMLHSDLQSLHPDCQEPARLAVAEAKLIQGLKIWVVETLREYLVQAAYRFRGLKNSKGELVTQREIEFAYEKAGLPKPDLKTTQTCCTNTLISNHMSGRAIDIGVARLDGKPVTLADWKAVAQCFIKQGATWGKDWDRDGLTLEDGDADEAKWIQDAPHFEWPA